MNERAFSLTEMWARLPIRGWKQWAQVAGLYLLVYGLWLLLWPTAPEWRLAIGDLVLLPPGLLAVGAAFALRRARIDARLKRFWTYIALALLVWVFGDVILAFYEVVLRTRPPVPSLADPVSLTGYPLTLVGLLAYPGLPRVRFGRIRLFLDIAIASGAITALVWLVFLRPVLAPAARLADVFWAAVYPTADLALLLILFNVFLIMEPGQLRSALGFVCAGVGALILTDFAYAYLVVRGQYLPGSPVGLGWVMGYGLLGLGAVYQRDNFGRATPPPLALPRLRFTRRLQALLPLAAVIALGWYTILDWQLNGVADPLAVWTTLLLGLAVVARQGVVAGEVELLQYAHLVNSAADPAFICDADGRLQLVNPALLAAAGYAREDELLGRSALHLLAPLPLFQERGLQPEHLFTLGLESGWSGEVQMRRQDETEFPVYLSLRPLQSETRVRPLLAGTAHNLTEQKWQEAALRAAVEDATAARAALEALNAQLEAKVAEKTHSLSEAYDRLARQNEELQTLDQLKSEFVSLVSHELRAPLTNVAGGMELLLSRTADLPDSARDTLALVQAEIRRLTQFVETILDLSALEAGRLPIYPVPLRLFKVLDVARGQFAATPSGERLKISVPADLPPLLADGRALTSVLFHLVDNALKYAPEGDVTVDAQPDVGANRVRVRVSDRGPGVPPELREKIFEKFQRLNVGDAQAVYGHGLGLYMVRRLLRAMGGDVEIGDAPGGGARFTFWLPMAKEDE
jgi:PAS domain S-box-containing protein